MARDIRKHLEAAIAQGGIRGGIAPLVIGAAYLAGKLISGWLSHKGDSAKASAEKKAQDEAFNNQKGNWDAGQAQRGERLNAVQGLLQRQQPFLKSGVGAAGGTGPDYTFDPTVLAKLQKPLPFPGSHGADPGAGLGYAAAGSGVGSAADTLLAAYAAGKAPQSTIAGSALNTVNNTNNPWSGGYTPMGTGGYGTPPDYGIDPRTGQPRR